MFKWKTEEVEELPRKDLQFDESSVQSGCSSFCNKDNPACVGRGKDDVEVKLCWETMKDLRYTEGRYHISDQFYNHFICTECQDNYIVKSEFENSTFEPQSFKCLICRR